MIRVQGDQVGDQVGAFLVIQWRGFGNSRFLVFGRFWCGAFYLNPYYILLCATKTKKQIIIKGLARGAIRVYCEFHFQNGNIPESTGKKIPLKSVNSRGTLRRVMGLFVTN